MANVFACRGVDRDQGDMHMKSFLPLAAALLVASPAMARDKDLRTMTDANGETEVGFCSRPSPNAFGFPGHAFVTFSALRPDGSRDFRSVGQTVAAGASVPAVVFSYFGGSSVAGKQAEERYTSLEEACLTVQVNHSDYFKALIVAQPTLTAIGIPADVAASVERYSLGSDDCIAFALKVA
ncbi:MAG: hypothetical protein M3Y22_03230, partial [Pseudomonadota bacterium]|nr:hypothetical protein [Pseudomonadota bacterium]